MKLGVVIEETWDFFHEIYAELCRHHQVSVFNRRFTSWPIFRERRNRALFQNDLSRFMHQNEVVFFEWASSLLVAATQLPKTCGIVTRLHRYEMYEWVDKVDWNKVDKIILVSKAKQNEFCEKFPAHADKTVAINAAVDLNKFTYQPHSYSGEIGTLCHLAPRKRVYELILDFYELLQRAGPRPDGRAAFHLHIGGDVVPSQGDYYHAMQDLVKALRLDKSVTFHGKVTDTRNWYHNLDIFVSNSYSEGLQVAIMEAMASGCFTISHHWAGAEEMLPSENLYLMGESLQDKILAFDALSSTEKAIQKNHMHNLAQIQFNLDENKRRVRELVEQVGSNFHQKAWKTQRIIES